MFALSELGLQYVGFQQEYGNAENVETYLLAEHTFQQPLWVKQLQETLKG
jgi:hypothetical protein